MTDWQSISTAFTGLNVAATFVKGYLSEIKDAAVREKLTELLDSIVPLYAQVVTLYESNLTLIKKADDLEAKLKKIEDWNEEAKNYIPYEITPRVIVYMKKSQGETAGPILHFCPNCFDIHHVKSMIQFRTEDQFSKHYHCPNSPTCEFKFKIPTGHRLPPQTPPSPLAYT